MNFLYFNTCKSDPIISINYSLPKHNNIKFPFALILANLTELL